MKRLVIKAYKADAAVTITTVADVTMGVVCALVLQGFTEITIEFETEKVQS